MPSRGRADSGVQRRRPTGWDRIDLSPGRHRHFLRRVLVGGHHGESRGGSVTATIGTSLTFGDGFPYYTDPATGSCAMSFFFGGGTFGENMSCAGPITATTGVYSQASSGWLALRWAWHQLEEIGSERVWTTRPTITITFS
jgi:hypothetical protein